MAIKIIGSTIIDDSRNIINAGIVTAQYYYGDASNLSKNFPLVTNVLYVAKNGNDANPGTRLSEPKATIAAAVATAKTSGTTAGTVIKVSAGTYIENNPIALPDQVSIVGDSLREVSVTPQNTGDLFYVGTGNYIAQMSFVGAANTGAIVSFNPNDQRYINQSPYIQNCTNFIPNSIGLKIDGNNALGPTKSMVLDSYTQYNQGGIGCSITNEGYAQLVSMFTICNDVAVFCGSGSACDLTNSNSSFGNYGFVADGVSALKYTGINTSYASANSDTFELNLSTPAYSVSNALYDNTTGIVTITTSTNHNFQVGMGVTINGLQFTCLGNPGAGLAIYPSGNNGYIFEVKSIPSPNQFVLNVGVSMTPNQVYVSGGNASINVNRPFDGQVVYFGDLYSTVGKITVGSGGTGYTSPPTVTITPPSTSWGIQATANAEVKNGTVTAINIISNGRGYTSLPLITVSAPNVGVNTASLTVQLTPSYYSIQSSTPISSGISTITVTESVPYAVGIGTTVSFFKQSRVLASGHSFEYIGSGTEIATCLPSTGGVAIQSNETDPRNGGLVVYTSTDHTGNFRIGDGVVINQQTGTVSGTAYTKSLFSTLTPYILALGGGE
jgi:hypothetical protein